MLRVPGIFIDGAWQHGTQWLTVTNPSTEQPLAQVAAGDGDAVARAAHAARLEQAIGTALAAGRHVAGGRRHAGGT